MLAQAHFRLKQLLRFKLSRVGGRLVGCEEEYTSKKCSSCGTISDALGEDREANTARNILIKNREMLAL
jgi:transposase